MFPRSGSRFATFWVVVAALLLKAAVPLLAVAAARAQGHALVEICSVYGVKTVAVDVQGQPVDADPHDAAEAGPHCTLAAVLAVAGTVSAVIGSPYAGVQGRERPPEHLPPNRRDRTACWLASLTHAPPSRA